MSLPDLRGVLQLHTNTHIKSAMILNTAAYNQLIYGKTAINSINVNSR